MKRLAVLIFFVSQAALANPVHFERIMGYQPGKNSLSFQVRSGGCTQKSDFKVQVEQTSPYLAEVYLYRIHPDPCLSFLPLGTQIKFDLDELGLSNGMNYIIKNQNRPVQAWIWPE